ncbi:MAG: hypothetical protein RQ966_15370 [Acetobacteraceae bacterium]|nr:hypothetical protein [Acetobacteraceae bacterium]
MTVRTWTGTNGQFSDSTWTGGITPQPGDTAIISTGTVLATGLTLGQLNITVQSAAGSGGTFDLIGSTVTSSTTLTVANPNAYGAGVAPVLLIQDTSTNNGAINITGSNATVGFQSSTAGGSGTLVNNGSILLNDASPLFQPVAGFGTPVLTNNGTITVANPDKVYQSPTFGLTINGTGTIAVAASGKVDFAGAVGNGQVLTFTGGVNANSVVQIDAPSAFGATVAQFVYGDTITVTNTPYTRYTYTSTGAQSGTLTLYNGSTATGTLNLAGNYTADKLTLAYNQLDSTHSTLVITTNVVDTTTGATYSGSANAVYRFFDTKYGTHFFTSDQGEKNAVLAGRPDLKEETNGFGDVSQNDGNAVAVYRFFDTNFGTHFFTSSASERDSIIQSRPDLTYEPSSTFYEHGTAQTGDVAVYRLFDQKTGTQFLTGDQGEYKGITTPGSATYRADLKSEGVAFYAPQGSYT